MLSQAEFKAEISAVCQQMGKVFGDGAVKCQTVLPAVQCKSWLVFLHGRFQPRHFLARYIRRVADQRVERADKARPSFSRVQPDCRYAVHKLQTLDIALGDGQRGARNIRKRHMGIRPTVRGSVMNPNDHPHGGGEGRAPVGRPGPVTPWGKPAMGLKTRKAKNPTNKFIIKRRNGK
mgnify:CR=1 FL=1